MQWNPSTLDASGQRKEMRALECVRTNKNSDLVILYYLAALQILMFLNTII